MPYTPLELAAAFIKTGELDDALDALNQHLAATPSDDEARRMRIETLLRMPENYQLALTDCDALSTPTADDCLKRSILCEKLNNLDSALQSMDTALQLQPGTERLIERQLYLLQLKGDFAAALKLLDVVPSTWRWKQWAGDLAAQVNQPEAAIHHYTDALKLLAVQSDGMAQVWAHPLQANLLLARAEGYRITKQFDNSEADYLAAANLIPDDPLIPFYRGLIALAWGDEATAINLSQTAWQMANPRLQDEMRQELMSNPGYLALVNALKIDQNDPS